jgi:hypothetical protein
MSRLSDEARQERFCKLMNLSYLRGKGALSEAQIAQKLGFIDSSGSPSARVMYERLQEWGLPDWVVKPNDTDEGAETEKMHQARDTEDTVKVRRARSTGDPERLPPAGAARPLFRRALHALSRYVDPPKPPTDRPVGFMDMDFTDGAGELSFLEEYLQAGRFVSVSVNRSDPNEIQTVRRKDLSSEEWEQACHEYCEDPAQDHFLIGAEMTVQPEGAAHSPWDVLVKLIGVYVLTGEPLEPLLENLHPEPEKADREQLERLVHGYKQGKGYVPGMVDKAQQISRLIRGGTVRRGPSTPGLSERDLRAAWDITWRKEQGWSYAEIHSWLEKKRYPYTRADVERLGSINPARPE